MKNIDYINAGAGSGKTYILTKRLVEFITQGICKPEQVILTTFTELAASEFMEKAREELLKAKMIEEAVMLESAIVGTVHSMAYNFVSKYWYLLGRGVNSNVISDEDKRIYINQSLSDLLESHHSELFLEMLSEFNYILPGSSRPNDDFWKDHLISIIDKVSQYNINRLDESNTKSCELIDSIFYNEGEVDVTADIIEFLKIYIDINSDDINSDKKRREKAESLLSEINSAVQIRYYQLMSFKTLEVLQKHKTDLPNSDELHESVDMLLCGSKYGTLLKRYVSTIFDIASEWGHEYEKFKQENNLIDYNDMELLFLRLLDEPSVQQEIKLKYKVVFVDEFQDSSPTQVKIFDKLSELVDQSVWVGDPKQAIYGFRGSDMSLIQAISKMFTKSHDGDNLFQCEPLLYSWRSREPIVNFTNQTFVPLFSNSLIEDHVKLLIPDSHKDDENLFKKCSEEAISHWHFEGKVDEANTILAQQLAILLKSGRKIRDKYSKDLRDIIPCDIAILSRTNDNVTSISDALRLAGLKVNVVNGSTDVVELALVDAVLNYLITPTNTLAKARILYLTDPNLDVSGLLESRFDFLNIPDSSQNNKWGEDNIWIQRIDLLRDTLMQQALPELVEGVILKLDIFSYIKQWKGWESRVYNINRVISMATAYDQRCLQMGIGSSLNGFLPYLNEMSGANELTKYPDAINVLTYHKSKGLEWPIVILQDFKKGLRAHYKYMFGVNVVSEKELTKEDLYPQRYVQLLPNIVATSISKPSRTIVDSLEEKELCQYLVSAYKEELKRLLYVGITRARDFLITTSYGSGSLKWLSDIDCCEVKPNKCDEIIDLFGYGNSVTMKRYMLDDEFVPEQFPSELNIPKKPNICDLEIESRYISPSSRRYVGDTNCRFEILKSYDSSRIKIQQTSSDEMHTVGSCLHKIFCVYRRRADSNIKLARQIVNNLDCSLRLPELDSIISSMDNLYSFLELRYGAAVNVYQELPLSTMVDGQIIRGEVDLVWEASDSVVIVDYKSFSGSIEMISSTDSSHYVGKYAPQLSAYKDLIEKSNAFNGKKVVDVVIYYAVQGVVVKLFV